MKSILMLLSLFSFEFASAADIQPVRLEKMNIVSFEGEGGGWNPSLMRCQDDLDVLSEFVSLRNKNGFFSIAGECTDDSFDKEWPKGLYFASIMKSQVKTNLPTGRYSTPAFCLSSRSVSRTVSALSTKNVNIVLTADRSASCSQRMSPVRFDIYID